MSAALDTLAADGRGHMTLKFEDFLVAADVAISAARVKRPGLTSWGFDQDGPPLVRSEVAFAIAWLGQVTRTKRPHSRFGDSDSLRLAAGFWAGTEVSNGALIAAAMSVGFTVWGIASAPGKRGTGRNAILNIGSPLHWPAPRRP